MPRVAVVIPNWNGLHHLGECLGSLEEQVFQEFETFVVDNGSSDESVSFVRSSHPSVRVIELESNRGFSAAVNAGIRASKSEYVALLNNDTRIDPDWLYRLVTAMDEIPEASLAASKMLLYSEPTIIDAAGDAYSIRLGSGLSIGKGLDSSAFRERRWVFGACAGAAIYRRGLFEDIGLFDEEFFFLFEDVDISMRAQIAGHRCLYVPNAVVYHKRGGSGRLTPDMRARALRNRLWVAGKSLPITLLGVWALCSVPRLAWVVARRVGRRLARRAFRLVGSMGAGHAVSERETEGDQIRSADLREIWVGLRQLPRKRRATVPRRAGTAQLIRAVTGR